MTTTINQNINERISHLEIEFEKFKDLIEKESNLNSWAKLQLDKSRNKSKEEFIDLDDL